MDLLITGGTGLIGRRLVIDRVERGDRVRVVSRSVSRAAASLAAAGADVELIQGDPGVPGPWQKAVDGCDAVVHLAGAGIADRRWTAKYKRMIVDSRIDGTFQVVEAINAAKSRPAVLVSTSAVGWYGDTGDRETDETAEPALHDFFGDLAARWEREAARAEAVGTRVVLPRFGVVLDERGGALRSMVRPFKMFVGGPIGAGRQYVPWIHWRDVIGIIDLALREADLRGPINCTAPNPVTNRDFSRAIGRALGRPSWLPVPVFMLRIALGEMARYAVMSQRVVPARAKSLGYQFAYPEIQSAMSASLSPVSRTTPMTPTSEHAGFDD